MLKVAITEDKKKLGRQIAALKWQIEHDTNEKDRTIHKEALRALEGAR